MGSLASKLSDVRVESVMKAPKTPCFPLYGWGDKEDLMTIQRLRDDGAEWAQVQTIVDKAAEVEHPLPLNKFIRHWLTHCSCWKKYRGEL